jgi:hypothetical protein
MSMGKLLHKLSSITLSQFLASIEPFSKHPNLTVSVSFEQAPRCIPKFADMPRASKLWVNFIHSLKVQTWLIFCQVSHVKTLSCAPSF